ncbi:hypothetical protein LSTR_LSTR003385 [Laodelphax striatellus]|uniref:Uncharacterized protein n=1 Tax=Laodelphax striatellus TaxID=195883 RepID=A0A482X4Q0_LAOST|nr:hypothetical protein LSTR_LSTR003385 [Laodelphax striatellus]
MCARESRNPDKSEQNVEEKRDCFCRLSVNGRRWMKLLKKFGSRLVNDVAEEVFAMKGLGMIQWEKKEKTENVQLFEKFCSLILR